MPCARLLPDSCFELIIFLSLEKHDRHDIGYRQQVGYLAAVMSNSFNAYRGFVLGNER
jgi:hypothetical protein